MYFQKKNKYDQAAVTVRPCYKSQFVNAGNVQNQGFELTAGWFQDFGNEFTFRRLSSALWREKGWRLDQPHGRARRRGAVSLPPFRFRGTKQN